TAEFTVGEGELMTHDEPFFMAPDDKHDLISGTCSHLPKFSINVGLILSQFLITFSLDNKIAYQYCCNCTNDDG
ncbi:hypothetical protein, partial [Aeromonas caviae]|uniref:hypothetical protein n=1 Tax=Aeromonas caviae TaxID=648 RepID=UPI001CC43A44